MDSEAIRPQWQRVRGGGATHIGLREHNEDAVLLRKELGLFVLADGAGGESAGATASALATTSVAHYFERTKQDAEQAPDFDVLGLPSEARRLSRAVHAANEEIYELAHRGGRYAGMATTVVVAYLPPDRGELHLAHVGDSRAYRLREGRLELLTEDHSLLRDVLELAPEIDDAQAEALPRAVITRALGVDGRVRATIRSLEVAHGDRYLLCSDGLTDELDDEQLKEALLEGRTPDATVALLLEVADAAGAVDNVAAVVVDVSFDPTFEGARPPVRLRARSTKRQRPDEDDHYPEVLIIDGESAVEFDDDGDGDEEAAPKEGAATTDTAEDGTSGADAANGDADAEGAEAEGADAADAGATEVDEDAQTGEVPGVRMVPEGSGTPARVAAVKHFLRPIPPSARPRAGERDPTTLFKRRCRKCGEPYSGTKDACPNCWTED